MKQKNNRMRIILAGAALIILLAMGGLRFVAQQGVNKDGLQETPVHEATPGLVVYGIVKDLNGVGVENVSIYRQYSSYQGVLIATTDASGSYRSDFYFIPGDEMITVWATRSGLVFEPEYYYWRHYYGYQDTERNFQAQLR